MCTVRNIARAKRNCNFVHNIASRARLTKAAPQREYAADVPTSRNDEVTRRHEKSVAERKHSTTLWLQSRKVQEDRAASFVFSRVRIGRIDRPCSGVAFAGRCTQPHLHEDDHHAHAGRHHTLQISQPLPAVTVTCYQITHVHSCLRQDATCECVQCSWNVHAFFTTKTA